MFYPQACSIFRSHQNLSACNWSASARSLTGERGSTMLDQPTSNPSECLLNQKAHPKKRLALALFSVIFFFPTAIAGIVFALKSFDCERHGHYEQALIYSRRSFSWSMTTLVMGLFFYLTVGLLIFIRRVQNY